MSATNILQLVEDQKREIERLRASLSTYAEETAYDDPTVLIDGGGRDLPSWISQDRGETARAALARATPTPTNEAA